MSKAPTTLKPGTKVERAFAVVREAVDVEARTAELSFASELPYERWWGVEVLDCTATAMRQGRIGNGRAPLLCDHDTRDQIGVVQSVTIGADRVARALVRFGKSERASEIFQDVVDGIRANVSVGYLIHKAQLFESTDDADTYRVTDWEPYEVSIVSVPADASVGVGRSAEDPRIAIEPAPAALAPEFLPPPTTTEQRNMQAPDTTQAVQAAATAAPALNISADAAQIRKAEQTRVSEILAVGDQFAAQGGREIAMRAIEAGEGVDAVRAEIMNALAAKQTSAVTHLDMSPAEVRRFSVLRAVRAMAEKDPRVAGIEREANAAICKRMGIQEAPHGGFFVPMDVQGHKRDLTAGTPTAGGNLVATNLAASSFIELLRARSVVAGLGATMLPGLVGNVAIPKLTGAATAYWLANEAAAATESQQTIGQVALAPKNLAAYTEVSRQLMLQSTPAADQLVMGDFARVLGLAVDLAALEGPGTGGAPTGISATAGIGSVTGTTLGLAGIIEFQTDVAAGNALSANSAYVTTPNVAALLMARQRFASTDTPLWGGNVLDGNVMGYRATTTTQVTAASMVFGDFSNVVIGEWGFLEIALNPYASFAAAITGIRAIQTVDVAIRQAAAFSRATTIT
jgi:HK97 family phage major capsid protein